MEIKIKVTNKTPELMQKVEAATSRFVRKGVAAIEGEIKSSMAEPKSGREYERKGGRIHVASAAGESPANDYGDYDGTIQSIFERTLEGKVGTPIEYALFLEEGTDDIEERPLWEKTAKEMLPTLEAMLEREIKKTF